MARHGHDRAGSVLHQHVVGDEDRDLLAANRVCDSAAQCDACLLAFSGAAQFGAARERLLDVVADRLLVPGSLSKPQHVRVLGGEHEEGRAEECVGPRREDRVFGPQLVAAEDDLGPFGAADPVALHRLDVLRPVDLVQIFEQAVGVIGDLEEPLLELADLNLSAAALAAAVNDLLVREHRLVARAPVDVCLLPIGKPGLEQLVEDPLRPAVVVGLAGGQLARPVDRDSPATELALELGDRRLG